MTSGGRYSNHVRLRIGVGRDQQCGVPSSIVDLAADLASCLGDAAFQGKTARLFWSSPKLEMLI